MTGNWNRNFCGVLILMQKFWGCFSGADKGLTKYTHTNTHTLTQTQHTYQTDRCTIEDDDDAEEVDQMMLDDVVVQ